MTVYVVTGFEGAFHDVFASVDDALAYIRKDGFFGDRALGTRPWAAEGSRNLIVTVDGEPDDWYSILPREVRS